MAFSIASITVCATYYSLQEYPPTELSRFPIFREHDPKSLCFADRGISAGGWLAGSTNTADLGVTGVTFCMRHKVTQIIYRIDLDQLFSQHDNEGLSYPWHSAYG